MAATTPYQPPSSDPDQKFLSQSAFDLLLIELVPMAQRLAEQVWIEDQAAMNAQYGGVKSGAETEGAGDAVQAPEEDEIREAMYYRLERLGYRVGLGLVESLTVNTPLLSRTDALDTLKFVCKDLWLTCFRKQIDNLKTNHRGVFVLTDNTFYPLRRASLASTSTSTSSASAAGSGGTQRQSTSGAGGAGGVGGVGQRDTFAERARPFLWFPCGLIRGAVVGCGWDVESVRAEVGGSGGGGAVFTVRLVQQVPGGAAGGGGGVR